MPNADHCSECGSPSLEEVSPDRLKCRHCWTVFRVHRAGSAGGATVQISKGARVTFGRTAQVVIKGSVRVDEGAQVAIEGELTVLEPGDPELIRSAKGGRSAT